MTDSGLDTKLFLTEFGAIASAPNGVQKLRQMVLQLAVQGKLVNHFPQNGNVREELIGIYRLREEYEKRLGMRSARRTESESQQDAPYVIPSHWKWTQLGNFALYIQRGKGPKYSDRGSVRVISQKCVQWKAFNVAAARWIDDGSVEEYAEERFLQPGDLLWNSTGTGTAGRIGIFPEGIKGRSVTDSHVTIVRLVGVDSRYLWCHIASPSVQARIEPTHPQALVSGTTNQVELATGSVRALLVPLPPLAEQKRIVAKVDELMALCDRLEALQTHRRNQRTVLTKELLGRVSQGDAADIQSCLQNLSYLVTDADQVPEIRKAILSLSVQGKLVKQDAKDEPSVILLKRISINSFNKSSNQSSKTNFPSGNLPHGWAWAKFQDIAEIASNLVDPKKFLDAIHLAPNNVEKATGVLLPCNTVREDKVSSANHRFFSGQIVYSKIRPNLSKVVVVDFDGLCSADMYPINAKIEAIFLQRFMLSDEFLWQAVKNDTRIAMPKINQSELNEIWVKVPPLAEQKRIVAKVDEMMALCDALETKLRKASEVQELLAQTTIAMLTGIQTQEKESMKAPKTELVARLKLGKKPSTKDQAPLAALLVRHNGELSPNALHQHSSLSIDEFYYQLKFEMSQGWIVQPEAPTMRVEERR